jgi:membrane protein
MKPFLYRLYRALRRVFPKCITQTQAVAFNMFLVFFPMLLVLLGAVATSASLRQAVRSILVRLRPVLPPGAFNVLIDFLNRHSAHSWSLVALGLGATLLAGTQMMKLLMEGFRMVHGDPKPQGILGRHLRALLLLVATIAPFVITVNLVVFGRQLRGWMLRMSSMSVVIRVLWSGLYLAASLLIVLIVLSFIYRVGRPVGQPWNKVAPGAAVATVLWWVVSAALGYYMRHVPYSLVYGGLAAAIGLMLWMQLTATILFIGAAYNAEIQDLPA